MNRIEPDVFSFSLLTRPGRELSSVTLIFSSCFFFPLVVLLEGNLGLSHQSFPATSSSSSFVLTQTCLHAHFVKAMLFTCLHVRSR